MVEGQFVLVSRTAACCDNAIEAHSTAPTVLQGYPRHLSILKHPHVPSYYILRHTHYYNFSIKALQADCDISVFMYFKMKCHQRSVGSLGHRGELDQQIHAVGVSSPVENKVMLGGESSCTTQPGSQGNQSLSRGFSSIGITRIKFALI